MPIEVGCRCGRRLKVPDQAAGKKVKCPACGAVVQVPEEPRLADVPPPVPATGDAEEHSRPEASLDFLKEAQPASRRSGAPPPIRKRSAGWRSPARLITLGAIGVVAILAVVLLCLLLPSSRERKLVGIWQLVKEGDENRSYPPLEFLANGDLIAHTWLGPQKAKWRLSPDSLTMPWEGREMQFSAPEFPGGDVMHLRAVTVTVTFDFTGGQSEKKGETLLQFKRLAKVPAPKLSKEQMAKARALVDESLGIRKRLRTVSDEEKSTLQSRLDKLEKEIDALRPEE
jgi:hypothetical protein